MRQIRNRTESRFMVLRRKVSRLRTAPVFLCESAQRTRDSGRQEGKWGRENRKTKKKIR